MARKLRALVEGRALFNDDGTINEQAFLKLLNAVRPPGEPEMTLEECRAVLAEIEDEDHVDEVGPPRSEP